MFLSAVNWGTIHCKKKKTPKKKKQSLVWTKLKRAVVLTPKKRRKRNKSFRFREQEVSLMVVTAFTNLWCQSAKGTNEKKRSTRPWPKNEQMPYCLLAWPGPAKSSWLLKSLPSWSSERRRTSQKCWVSALFSLRVLFVPPFCIWVWLKRWTQH